MFMRTLYIILFCLPFLFSCEMKKDLLGGGKDSEDERPTYENVGLLDLDLNPEKEPAAPGTKGEDGEDDLRKEDFTVSILDSLGQIVKEYESFGLMAEDGGLLLPVGKYTVKASLGNDPKAGYDSPYYAGDTTCVVSEKEVSKVIATCNLQNKKIQFLCTNEFLSQFNDNYYIVIDNGLGVLTLTKDEERIAYLKNTGSLRFTLYATTHDNVVHTYSHDLSKDELVQSHNNVLIALGTPDQSNDNNGNNNNPADPDEPEEPDEPVNPDVPDVPVKGPVIKVDVSLIEKDYVIEIPSDFVESDKPDTDGGDNPGGDSEQKKISITGTMDGKTFDLGTTQTISASTKSVAINLYLPTGLETLKVTVNISALPSALPLDLLNENDANLKEITELLEGMGKKLVAPAKGSKGNQKFDITPFLDLLVGTGGSSSFAVTMGDKNGETISKTLKLTVK